MSSFQFMDEFCNSTFWDSNLTWHTSDPNFTSCFQITILVWIPCIFLWLCLPIELIIFRNSKNAGIPWTSLNIAKTIISTTLALLNLITVLYANTERVDSANVLTVSAVMQLVTYILVISLTYFSRKFGVMTSGVLFLFWTLSAITGFARYFSLLQTLHRTNHIEDTVMFTMYMVQYPLTLSMFALSFLSDGLPKYRKHYQTSSSKESPEVTASFASRIFFSWIFEFIWKGWRRPLTFDDLYDLNYSDKAATVTTKFEKNCKATSRAKRSRVYTFKTDIEETELNGEILSVDFPKQKTDSLKEANIIPSLIKTFWPYFIATSFVRLIYDILFFANPKILGWLIEFVRSEEPMWKGYFYAGLLFVVNIILAVLWTWYFRRIYKLGNRTRSVVMSVIYKKVLRLSNTAKRNLSVGVILNTMSVDADRFPTIIMELNLIWSAPLKVSLCLYFLWELIGPSVFAGVAIIFLLIPLNGYLARNVKRLQAKLMVCKDTRLKMMSEILNGIKVLKLYGWEKSFMEKILQLRQKEISLLRKIVFLNAITTSTWFLAPFLVAIGSFTAFILSDEKNVLTATTAFVSLRLLNMMRMPLTDIPDFINYMIVARVSVKRINMVLNSQELEDYVEEGSLDNTNNVIEISDASFRWDEDGVPILKNLNVNIARGSFVAIVGQVGCGKSSFISSILGDMEKIKGTVKSMGSMSYVPQQAWIQNATLRSNILFDEPMDIVKYRKIVEACALDVDFQILPGYDQTEIGEKGINLSGGQKQRVSLARAVYRDSDIVLLDDPLGAVDSHVGKHIFDKVIGKNGILKDKTRILVTHSVTFLPEVDIILVMKNGEISERGSYQEIIRSNGAFKDFLSQHVNDDKVDDETLTETAAKTLTMRQISRQMSTTEKKSKSSTESLTNDKARDTKKSMAGKELVKAEIELRGSTSWSVYKEYINAMNLIWFLVVVFGFVVQQGCGVGSGYWLSLWSQDAERELRDNGTEPTVPDNSLRNTRLSVYGVLGLCQAMLLWGSVSILAVVGLRASNFLHESMLVKALRSPMSFFDTTPTGRILNRFAKDVDSTDTELPNMIRMVFINVIQIFGLIVSVVLEIPLFLLVAVPISSVYGFAQRLYLAVNRQIKRMEANSRSPLYSHFAESISGASSIRAYGAKSRFILQSQKFIDNNALIRYLSRTTARWLSFKLEIVGNTLLFFAGLFTVLSRDKLSPGAVGFVITSANELISQLFRAVISTSNLESALVSVERLSEYTHLKTEASWEIADSKPNSSWPEKGQIIFSNYSTRYRDDLDLVLKKVSFTINPSEKVGVVGRTGAGKTSLTLALFRLVEAVTGEIIIDGVDISRLGLFDLRSKITIIPQDPVLFSGSLRFNLDPFEVHSDEEIWNALELAHLKGFVESAVKTLNLEIAEGGDNLSVGQRQLICLARALLRKTKILVLDEATASVDLDTDDLIQSTIRNEFRECTVLTIAHRLNTIMDYDRVMVMDMGCVAELETPSNLLENTKSVFYGMAKDAGLV